LAPKSNYQDKGVCQFLLTNLQSTTPLTFRIPIDILSSSLSQLGGFPLECNEESCPEYNKPALFIRGTQSGYVQPKHFPVMERMFPKMEVVELDGSHWIHVDQPEGVFRTMCVLHFVM
jgi:pimeloyl-ACP methyl ester carboxylesterase